MGTAPEEDRPHQPAQHHQVVWLAEPDCEGSPTEQLRTARLPAVGAEVFGVGLAGLVVDRVLGMQGKL